MECYSCLQELTEDNKSKEHIIPNFLGGKLNSYWLLCKNCNSTLGHTLDAALNDELFYHNLISIKKDRPGGKRATGVVENENFELLINPSGYGLFYKPKLIFDDYGNLKSVVARDQEQAIALLKRYERENKNFNLEDFLAKSNWTDMGEKVFRLSFAHRTMGSDMLLRAVAKIALNFYLWKEYPTHYVKSIKGYVCTGLTQKEVVRPFYPLNQPFEPRKDELNNIMYLRGNSKSQLLYCYVEIFNVSKFIVILNDAYTGEDFSETYIWDVLNAREIYSTVSLNIIINPLLYPLKVQHIQEEHKKYFDRYLRLVERIHRGKIVAK